TPAVDPRQHRRILGVVLVQVAGLDGVATGQVGEDRPWLGIDALGHGRAAPVGVLVRLHSVVEHVVDVGPLEEQRPAAVRRPLRHAGQLVAVVVGVVPGFGAGALALLGEVALVVVGVGVEAVVGQPVSGTRLVAGHGAVAVGIVTVRLRPI